MTNYFYHYFEFVKVHFFGFTFFDVVQTLTTCCRDELMSLPPANRSRSKLPDEPLPPKRKAPVLVQHDEVKIKRPPPADFDMRRNK